MMSKKKTATRRRTSAVPTRVEPNTVVIPLVKSVDPKKLPGGERPVRIARAAIDGGGRSTAAQVFARVMKAAPRMGTSAWKDVRWWLRVLAKNGIVRLEADNRRQRIDEETLVLAEALREKLA